MKDNNDINDDVVRDFLKNSSGEKDFKLPDDYFKGFQSNVYDRIKSPSLVWWRMPQFKVAVSGFACAILIVLVLGDFKASVNVAEQDFSQDELVAYFSDNIDELAEDEILEVLAEDDLNIQSVTNDTTKVESKPKKEKAETPKLEDFTDEEIYEYMMEDGYDDGDWDNL